MREGKVVDGPVGKSFFAAGVGIMLLICPFDPVLPQTEYYVPQRQRPIQRGQLEMGLQVGLRSSGGTDRYYELTPSVAYSPTFWPRFQFSAELPLVRGDQSVAQLGDGTETDFGDLVVRTRYTLMGEADWQLVGSFEAVFATGENPFENEPGTGDGFNRYTPGLTFLYLKDPLSTFFYVGYEVSSEETFDIPPALSQEPQTLRDILRLVLFGPRTALVTGKNTIEPGSALRLRGGTAILLNPTIRLNLFTSISLRGNQTINGETQVGSRRDDAHLGTGLDFTLDSLTEMSTNVVFGMNDASETVAWTMVFTYRY